MKTIHDKIERVIELKNEIRVIKTDFKTEMYEYVREEFLKRGFIEDPRGDQRSLYNPETQYRVRIGNSTLLSTSISVLKMINDGMEFNPKSTVLNDGPVLFNFTKKSFDKFFTTDFKRHYTKQDNLIENTILQ